MAPRTSASNLSFGGKGVEQEVVVTEKKKQVTVTKRSAAAETSPGKPTRLEVNLVNLKLPLTTVTKRARPREPREEEPATKRHRIRDAGRELTVDCSINRPRCQVCKLNMPSAEALRYHNMMTHSSLQITAVSPAKEEPVPGSPGRRVVRVKVQREVAEVGEVETRTRMVETGPEEALGEQLSESPKKVAKGKVPNSKAAKRGYKRAASRETIDTGVGTKTEEAPSEASLAPGQQETEPLAGLLTRTLAHLAAIDRTNVFRDPVDLVKVPDYLTYVARPMDFHTMAGKVAEGRYGSIAAFEVDFRVVVANCQAYNVETTSFWRAARRMGNLGAKVLQMAREGRLGPVGQAGEEASQQDKKPRHKSVKPQKRKSKARGEGDKENLETYQAAKKPSEKASVLCLASPGDSGVSTTAPDSDASVGSEFAVPGSVPRRKSSRPSGPRRPEITGPMEGEFTGRRQSERRFGGEKPFMCNHCPLTFSNLAAKVGHERTHQEKPLECPWCEMRFEGELGLRRHTRIHTKQLLTNTSTSSGATSTSSGVTSTSSGISTGAGEDAGPSG